MKDIYEKYNIKTKNTKQIFFVRRICSELRGKKRKEKIKKRKILSLFFCSFYIEFYPQSVILIMQKNFCNILGGSSIG